MAYVGKRLTAKAVAVALVAQSMALTGCVTTQADRIGKNDGSDSCYPQRVALDNTRSFYAEDMLKGALAGAAIGLTAALIGGASGQTTALATLGGAAGGGALGAFWANLEQQQGRDGAVKSALGSVQKENANLKKTQSAMDDLVKCRRGQIAAVKADYKAKRITKAEGEFRMAEIRGRIEKDQQIAQEINKNVGKRQDEYAFALNQVGSGKKKNPEAQKFAQETSTSYASGQAIAKSTSNFVQMSNETGNLDG